MAIRLTDYERAALAILAGIGSGGGYPVRTIAPRLVTSPGTSRQKSALTRSVLECLHGRRYVKKLDSELPVIWCITDAGRAALTPATNAEDSGNPQEAAGATKEPRNV